MSDKENVERPSYLASLKETLAPLTRRISWIKPTPESDLRYTILPPYEIPKIIVVSGLIVENRGGKAAHNVAINIRYDETGSAMIHHMQVVSEEEYVLRGGGEQHRFAVIRLREMSPGSKLFVYMAASDSTSPQVTVTSFEKPAARR
jgi:hypothetical protein